MLLAVRKWDYTPTPVGEEPTGAETVIGPAYLGYGVTDGGRRHFYLIIGERF